MRSSRRRITRRRIATISVDMGIVVGLDVGGSNTKIVGLSGRDIIDFQMARASDPVASAFGALGKFLDANKLAISDIECLKITGVGADFPSGDLLGIPTLRVKEFLATGLGGLFLTGLSGAVVVSMGTGTAFIEVRENSVRHIIGSGVGGGTLLGLSHSILHIRDFDMLSEMSASGNLAHIDLSIGDISKVEIPGLSMDTTASNFGKTLENAEREDLAAGIVNLVYQSVGTMAVLAARTVNTTDIILTGHMTSSPSCREIFDSFSKLYEVTFHIPDGALYATAIGAGIV